MWLVTYGTCNPLLSNIISLLVQSYSIQMALSIHFYHCIFMWFFFFFLLKPKPMETRILKCKDMKCTSAHSSSTCFCLYHINCTACYFLNAFILGSSFYKPWAAAVSCGEPLSGLKPQQHSVKTQNLATFSSKVWPPHAIIWPLFDLFFLITIRKKTAACRFLVSPDFTETNLM